MDILKVSKALHDYKQEELDKFYIPMLAHPVVVQLFEKSQHLEVNTLLCHTWT